MSCTKKLFNFKQIWSFYYHVYRDKKKIQKIRKVAFIYVWKYTGDYKCNEI